MTTAKKNSLSVPAALMPIYENLVGLTEEFCEQHLNAEYAELCRQMAAALCRKRPSPLVQGTQKAWGCGIVYTLGRVNFLFDRRPDPSCECQRTALPFWSGPEYGFGKGQANPREPKNRCV